MTDWFSALTQARRDIHVAFALRAQYSDSTLEAPVDISVNWHSRFGLPVGDIGGGDYSGVLETVDRLVFDSAELSEKGLVLRRTGQVTLLDYNYTFTLDVREPNTRPVRETWSVAN